MATAYNAQYTVKTALWKIAEVQNSTEVAPRHFINETLNAKHTLWQNDLPKEALKLRYFGLGLNGRYLRDDKPVMSAYVPSIEDMDLSDPIPFRCVPLEEDISAAERDNYRIRKVLDIHGQKYVHYFLKKMKPIDTQVQVYRFNPKTNILEPYELDPENLYPKRVKPTTNNVQNDTASNIVVGTRYELPISAKEMYEYIDVKYGDRDMGVFSEIGIYAGEDRVVNVSHMGQDIQYLESISTILSFAMCNAGVLMENESWSQNRKILVGDLNCFLV